MPIKKLTEAYRSVDPSVTVLTEAAGSRICARKIRELNRQCDLMISADESVIETLLIPENAEWYVTFASNEMGIAYGMHSLEADLVNSSNWPAILLRPDVTVGRSDLNSDPCGYRTVLVLKLAEKALNLPGFAQKVLQKPATRIRPKETDLIGLLQVGEIDYLFIYRSIAVQHDMPFIRFPDNINLGNPEYQDQYSKVSLLISGKKPGSRITKEGDTIKYALTIPVGAEHAKAALDFIRFLLSEPGRRILRQCGMVPYDSPSVKNRDKIPESLFRKYKKLNKPGSSCRSGPNMDAAGRQ